MESVVRSIEKEMRIARNKGEVFGYKAIVLNDGEYKKIKSRPQK